MIPGLGDARCVTVDEDQLARTAADASPGLFARAGLTVPHKRPVVPSA